MSAQVPPRASVASFLAFGLTAFLLAALSIVDMYLPRPYDGVILDPGTDGRVRVQQVVPGSGAARAGLHSGDVVVGIARTILRSSGHAASLLNQHEIGERVPYLIRTGADQLKEVSVELGRRRVGDTAYLYACILGFSFFFIGLFVLLNQPQLASSRLFFILCALFLLFLVCRMRPASYSWVDVFVLTTGTAALLFLPPAFLHFFLIFPHPIWSGRSGHMQWLGNPKLRNAFLAVVYAIPLVVFWAAAFGAAHYGMRFASISGTPSPNWWVLASAILLGLIALGVNSRRLTNPREKRGALIVLVGSLLGLVPFVVLSVAFSSFLHTDQFIFYGIVPLILVPLTFTYGIVRFQLLDVKFILRRSLLYTLTTAGVTLFYAVGIATFNGMTRGSELATSPYFPIVFALTIALLFEPVRRLVQIPIDRFFFARRSKLQAAMVEMGEAFTAEADPGAVVSELVNRLPQLLELGYAALYLMRHGELERIAGPASLPSTLPYLAELHDYLRAQRSLTRVDSLGGVRLDSAAADALIATLERAGAEVLGELSSRRR
ncbi:MAG: hypothetical protein WBX15_15840, partial [Thermoanaerobaculia bacterium]